MTSIASMIRTHRGADEVFAAIVIQYREIPQVDLVAFENRGGPLVSFPSIPSNHDTRLTLMNDSIRMLNPDGTFSSNTSTQRPSGKLADAICDAARRYGSNTDLYLRENPQFDRRIDRVHSPQPV